MQSFVSSKFSREEAMALVLDSDGQMRYRGELFEKSEALFAVPQRVANLQVILMQKSTRGNAVLPGFFYATRQGSDLESLSPTYLRWILSLVPQGIAPATSLAGFLREADIFASKLICGHHPDASQGLRTGKSLLNALADPSARTVAFIGIAAFLNEPGTGAEMLLRLDEIRASDPTPMADYLTKKLTRMLAKL